jgi:hypothetical protein|tara:strand:+ start:93 stop:560 length:468 start_codon:yes stop_codon:yes gene_type:complete
MNAKEILKNKFWIVEDNRGVKFGTISLNEEQYILSTPTGTQIYHDSSDISKALDKKLSWTDLEIKDSTPTDNQVNKYPTSCTPYNPMYDVKRKLPLFTKSEKSKSLYAAGYYVIQFEKGWVKSFCPKLITVERYVTKGPFKTELEMRQELSRANR